jgi:hypothetical protein
MLKQRQRLVWALESATSEMADIPNTPTSPTGAAPTPPFPPAHAGPLPLPSGRATAVLAAAMLAVGVAVGAAIGPAPGPSFAGTSPVPLLLPTLTALASAGPAGGASTAAVQPPSVTPEATPSASAGSGDGTGASTSQSASSTPASPTTSTQTPSTPPSSIPTTKNGGSPKKTLAPVTNVWLIELSGSTFEAALAQPAAAPYIDGQAIPAGALLSGWSALDGSAFASEAALLASTPPQLLDTIVQPPCPEGAAGVGCAAGTPAGLTAADEFLKVSVRTITATAAYRAHGLIVVTFGSIVSASATELPSGATNATLTSGPPVGVLLISPFASANTRPPATSFNPPEPRKSLEKLLHQ